MNQDNDCGKQLAQNLVDLLAPYEEELIQLERDVPALGPLRRALGIVIAEACYCISDTSSAHNDLVRPSGGETRRT